MAWSKQTWVDDDGSGTVGTAYTASRMNNIETGVEEGLAQGLIGEAKDWPGISLPSVPGAEYKWTDGTAVSRTTYKTLFERLCISTTANRTSGSKALKSIPSTTNMKLGMPISGTGIKANTFIETVNSASEITMSQTAESTGTGGGIVVAPHGVGDGSTTFNLPDTKGRTVVSPDDMGGSDAGRVTTAAQQLGGVGGEERHTLSVAEMPNHTHAPGSGGSFLAGGVGTNANLSTGGGNFVVTGLNETGGGGSHQNMQPFVNFNRIIRVL